jgi:hypothetical protein
MWGFFYEGIMPSTYTNIGLEKQATGENANSWGDITNTNFDIVDEAITGVYTISSSATSQSISAPSDGTSNQSTRRATFVYSGSPSGAVTVTLPSSVSRVINVVNNYSQNITFQVGNNSTTATVFANSSGIIHSDGSNTVYALSEGSASQLRHNGVTKGEAVSGGVNITGVLNVSSNAAVSGTLSAAATTLSGALDTGNNAITSTSVVNVGSLSFASNGWTVDQVGTDLVFVYNGTNKMKIDSSGNLTVTGNVTAYGSV